MIAFLQGTLEIKRNNSAVLNVNGVGYHIEISSSTFEKLPAIGEEVRLLIHHHITDSDQRLFGFFSGQEQKLFERLITVKGVGPKLGLTIMSGMKASMLVDSIIQQDQQGLSRIPGIGKKTAQRIILELKDKILESVGADEQPSQQGFSSVREEAICALEALGFKKRDAEKAVMDVSGENGSNMVQDVIKRALSQLNK